MPLDWLRAVQLDKDGAVVRRSSENGEDAFLLPELIVPEFDPRTGLIGPRTGDRPTWFAKPNIVTATIGNPRPSTLQGWRRRSGTGRPSAFRSSQSDTACKSGPATRRPGLVRPRHIAPRQRGAGRPAGSRRAPARSRSPGGGDSDPGESEPASGRKRLARRWSGALGELDRAHGSGR